MADMDRFSERMIDLAERFADVVDAAEGRGQRKSGVGARWLVLPAAGAAAYALATSSSGMARRTRALMRRAKDRATDLPDTDLFNRVKEVSGVGEDGSSTTSSGTSRSTGQRRTRSGGSGKSSSRRKTAASR